MLDYQNNQKDTNFLFSIIFLSLCLKKDQCTVHLQNI